jgi:capsular polysaccharide transport system permease protein
MKIIQSFRNWCRVDRLFRLTKRAILIFALLAIPYWGLLASNRYVSDAWVVLQDTDSIKAPSIDLSSIIPTATGSPTRPDQLLLLDYLTSVDMLRTLDAAFDLRSHYASWKHDPLSRMWFRNEAIEWFYLYWTWRSDIEYDDYSGAVHIQVQAFDPKTAHDVAALMVKSGEERMNEIGHSLAQSQVDFLMTAVVDARKRLDASTAEMIKFQNSNGLIAPASTAESLNGMIAQLETQKTATQIQLNSIPVGLNPNQPSVVMLKRNLQTIDQQITEKKGELATASGSALNSTVVDSQRLQLAISFDTDLYKLALSNLEQGRMNASRDLKKVSVLQSPTSPEWPLEPERFYNVIATIVICGGLIFIIKLLEDIILDHMD